MRRRDLLAGALGTGFLAGVIPYYTNVFEPLVGTIQEMEPAPVLATEWVRENESTWRFNLCEDVTFYNGSALFRRP